VASRSRLRKGHHLVDAGVTPEQLLQDYFSKLSLEDLKTIEAILRNTGPTTTSWAAAGR
jgi:hypothetical protein